MAARAADVAGLRLHDLRTNEGVLVRGAGIRIRERRAGGGAPCVGETDERAGADGSPGSNHGPRETQDAGI